MKNRARRLLSLVVAMLMVFGLMCNTTYAASKTSGKCGKNAKWTYNKKTKTLTITGKGTIKRNWPDYIYDDLTVKIKKGITAIDDRAFEDLFVKNITLPDTITSIGAAAFGGMEGGLSSITIPKNVKKIGKGAFGSYNLKSIKVAKKNKYFVVVNGVLYNKAKTRLIICPPMKKGSLTISSKTKTIEECAFSLCRLSKLVIPSSVKTVNKDAFLWAEIGTIYFKGKPPKGIKQELNDEVYAKEVYIPEEYYNDWADCVYNSTYKGKWNTWNP